MKAQDLPRPICSIADFRRIRSNKSIPRLVEVNREAYGIPQGTALSAVAANIAMLDFDLRMVEFMRRIGGLYRRYSDDIVVICPIPKKIEVEKITKQILRLTTRTLGLNGNKTDRVDFRKGSCGVSFQYLGFVYDGRDVTIRSSTLSKFGRRLTRAVHFAQKQMKRAAQGKIGGRAVIYRRNLNASFTHLGVDNFVTSYVRRAKGVFGDPIIGRQVARISRRVLSRL